MSKSGGSTIDFTYNENGIRTSKTVDGIRRDFTLIDDRITSFTQGGYRYFFRYNEDNELVGIGTNGGVDYAYVKNLQGDIIGIVDSNGNLMVEYTYDAWGKLLSIRERNSNGTMVDLPLNSTSLDSIATANPFRYRGYFYDTETGLYYLQSRYYNPEWGRFINADTTDVLGLSALSNNITSTNLFVYCNNNPIMFSDENGTIPDWAIKRWLHIYLNLSPSRWIGFYSIKSLLSAAGKAYLTMKKYYIARDMYHHGMWGKGGMISKSLTNRIINKAKVSSKLIAKIKEQLKNITGNSVGVPVSDVEFSTKNYNINDPEKNADADLYYGIQRANLSFNGKRANANSKWNLTVRLSDTYDFTEIRTFSKQGLQINGANLANDLGVIMEKTGMIKPYKWVAIFSITV